MTMILGRFIGLVILLLPLLGWYIWSRWKTKVDQAKQRREFERKRERRPVPSMKPSICCPPEMIRPPEKPKGICGIRSCKIKHNHSHAQALFDRLKETKR